MHGLADKLEGVAEEIKGKILRKAKVVEHGRERRTGKLMRKEQEQDIATNPFKASHAEGEGLLDM
ncbi:hypothetical protein J3R83DRAFT_3028 [Lanmaoa asiatica]|nr:hypothetical protein J3R83DRAFT_3028 [Lanmaoa asiatica]